jgi:beta-phosphoglucomutase-like phosphatase (HAD superfamily)
MAIATTTSPENVTALLKSTLGEDSPSWFEVIGAGDIVPGKKPAPDIYLWVLEQLGLSAQHCLALEDSENGLKAALAAGLNTLITVNGYTYGQDFSGARLVLSDLGELSQPYEVLAGNVQNEGLINVRALARLNS